MRLSSADWSHISCSPLLWEVCWLCMANNMLEFVHLLQHLIRVAAWFFLLRLPQAPVVYFMDVMTLWRLILNASLYS